MQKDLIKLKSLVTGGAGFIGSHIVDKLLSLGHEVIVIDNESAESHDNFYWNNLSKNYKIDICNYESVRPLFEGVNYVFHLAAESRIQIGIRDPINTMRTNMLGTATVLQCAQEANIDRVVYSSTSSAYGNNITPNVESQNDDCLNIYSISKTSGESLCSMYYKAYGLETVILRYFNVYGEREPKRGAYAPVIGLFFKQFESKQPLTIVGTGDQKRDFTHIDDVVNANVLAATVNISEDFLGTKFNIGTGVNYSINEIAKMYNHEVVYIPTRIGEANQTLANISKAKEILGWHPNKNIKTYIKQVLNICKEKSD